MGDTITNAFLISEDLMLNLYNGLVLIYHCWFLGYKDENFVLRCHQ